MKTIRLIGILLALTILFSVKPYPVHAQAGVCDTVTELFLDKNKSQMDPISGVNITVNTFIGDSMNGQNVVVVGQDPDAEGVGITVTLKSQIGYVRHDEKVIKDECIPTRIYKGPNVPQCDTDPYGIYYYYMTPTEICDHNIYNLAQRPIKSVLVWLEPSTETAAWLGWDAGTNATRFPLRYMFPEKWMTGTWTEDGFETSGTPDHTWTQSYYEAWLAQMSDYNFLAGDTNKLSKLFSVTMVEVTSPIDGTAGLGVFGNFLAGPNPSTLPVNFQPGEFNINYEDNPELIKILNGNNRVKYSPRSNISLTDQLSDHRWSIFIKMAHIPMDLPGLWTIGVMVEMERAQFEYKGMRRFETPPDDWEGYESKWFLPEEANYNSDAFFYSYVLLSTPCNPMEVDSCWDNSY
jgi:hypothetical protein